MYVDLNVNLSRHWRGSIIIKSHAIQEVYKAGAKQENKAGPGSNNYHLVQYSQRYEATSQSKAHEVLHRSSNDIGKLYWSSFEPDWILICGGWVGSVFIAIKFFFLLIRNESKVTVNSAVNYCTGVTRKGRYREKVEAGKKRSQYNPFSNPSAHTPLSNHWTFCPIHKYLLDPQLWLSQDVSSFIKIIIKKRPTG